MKTVIEVSDLTVLYSGQESPSVEKVSFSLIEGSITMLVGPNGSGKTTIIKAILGLVDYQGEIKVFNKEVTEAYPLIGFLPQRFKFDLSFPMTVAELINLALLGCRETDERKKSLFEKIFLNLEITDLKQKTLASLSGGQLQRVLLARALVHEPKLLVLDEPETGIDVGLEQSLYDLLLRIVKEQGVTILIASHELDVVFMYATQVICLNKKILCTGRPEKVLNQDTFEKLYGRYIRFYAHKH